MTNPGFVSEARYCPAVAAPVSDQPPAPASPPSQRAVDARQKRILSAGYVVLDVLIRDRLVGHSCGGTAGNVAANLAWLGFDSAVAARIGQDKAGRHVTADLAAVGTVTDYVIKDPVVQTPQVVHQVRADGTHRYLFSCPVCGRPFARYRPLWVADAVRAVTDFRPTVFFFDRVSSATLAAADATRKSGGMVVFEPNSRGRRDWTALAAAKADVVKVSGHVGDELLSLVRPSRRGQLQIVSLGEEGIRWRIGNHTWQSESALPGRVFDAGGAGDWLTAGFICDLDGPVCDAHSRELRDALRFGQALATLGCGYPGARGLTYAVTRAEAVVAAKALLRPTRGEVEVREIRPRRRRTARRDCHGCLRPVAAA
jgi:fructokinase